MKVKAEFEKFGGVIQKAQKNIQSGLTQLDDVVGVRTRAIRKELRNVESMNADQVKLFLPEAAETDTTDEEIEE